MSLKRVNKITSIGIPKFTGAIVAASNKFIPIFVKATVSERKHMPLEFFH